MARWFPREIVLGQLAQETFAVIDRMDQAILSIGRASAFYGFPFPDGLRDLRNDRNLAGERAMQTVMDTQADDIPVDTTFDYSFEISLSRERSR
jgi:hypothetical protein